MKKRVKLNRVDEDEGYVGRLPLDAGAVYEPDGPECENIGQAKPETSTRSATQQDGTGDVERQNSEELAFNIIQSIIVPRIVRKVDEICKKRCYGWNLPVGKDVTGTNHECLRDPMPEKVFKHFEDALREIIDNELNQIRMDWNILASGNQTLPAHYPTIVDTNRIFDKYVAIHVKRTAQAENQNVLCFNDCETY